jgi:protein-tyrosine phosphatase
MVDWTINAKADAGRRRNESWYLSAPWRMARKESNMPKQDVGAPEGLSWSRIWGALRRMLVSLRHLFDRLCHAPRRNASVKRLQAVGARRSIRSVLFVCLGNVCRSPYAASSLRKAMDGERMHADSAGFMGPGRNPPDRAIEAAAERGVHHAAHVSKLVSREMIERADAIFVFEASHARKLRELSDKRSAPVFLLPDFDSVWAGKRLIADPWGRSLEDFRRTFARIDRCLDTVRSALTNVMNDSARGDSSPSRRAP